MANEGETVVLAGGWHRAGIVDDGGQLAQPSTTIPMPTNSFVHGQDRILITPYAHTTTPIVIRDPHPYLAWHLSLYGLLALILILLTLNSLFAIRLKYTRHHFCCFLASLATLACTVLHALSCALLDTAATTAPAEAGGWWSQVSFARLVWDVPTILVLHVFFAQRSAICPPFPYRAWFRGLFCVGFVVQTSLMVPYIMTVRQVTALEEGPDSLSSVASSSAGRHGWWCGWAADETIVVLSGMVWVVTQATADALFLVPLVKMRRESCRYVSSGKRRRRLKQGGKWGGGGMGVRKKGGGKREERGRWMGDVVPSPVSAVGPDGAGPSLASPSWRPWRRHVGHADHACTPALTPPPLPLFSSPSPPPHATHQHLKTFHRFSTASLARFPHYRFPVTTPGPPLSASTITSVSTTATATLMTPACISLPFRPAAYRHYPRYPSPSCQHALGTSGYTSRQPSPSGIPNLSFCFSSHPERGSGLTAQTPTTPGTGTTGSLMRTPAATAPRGLPAPKPPSDSLRTLLIRHTFLAFVTLTSLVLALIITAFCPPSHSPLPSLMKTGLVLPVVVTMLLIEVSTVWRSRGMRGSGGAEGWCRRGRRRRQHPSGCGWRWRWRWGGVR